MKRILMLGCLAAATALSGCVVVPAHRAYGDGYRGNDGNYREYRQRDGDRYYYRNSYRDDRRDGGHAGSIYAP